MKKKIAFFVSFALVLCLAGSVAIADLRNTFDGEDVAEEIGYSIKEAVSELLAEEQLGLSDSLDTSRTFAVVKSEPISLGYFNVRTSLYEATGSADPEADAWDSILREVAERQFAEEHGLLPSEDEILAFCKEMRELAESEEESFAIGRTLVDSMGLTWEQYWSEYKPTYEAPAHLIKIKIEDYREENGLASIELQEPEYEIINSEYSDQF